VRRPWDDEAPAWQQGRSSCGPAGQPSRFEDSAPAVDPDGGATETWLLRALFRTTDELLDLIELAAWVDHRNALAWGSTTADARAGILQHAEAIGRGLARYVEQALDVGVFASELVDAEPEEAR